MPNGAHSVQEETGWNKAVELFQYAVVSGMELGSLSPHQPPLPLDYTAPHQSPKRERSLPLRRHREGEDDV